MNIILLAVGVGGLYSTIPLDILGIGYGLSYLVRLVVSIYYTQKHHEYKFPFGLGVWWLITLGGLLLADWATWHLGLHPIVNKHEVAVAVVIFAFGCYGLLLRFREKHLPISP